MEQILKNILNKIKESPGEYRAYDDMYNFCREVVHTDKELGQNYLKQLIEHCESTIPTLSDGEMVVKLFMLLKQCHRQLAYDWLHHYLIYLEWDRPQEKKFYENRMHVLRVVVDDLQDLSDRKIRILSVSLPVRVGKSTLCIFALTWQMGKFPDDANVMSGHSDKLTDPFYREAMSIITDSDTYNWSDVFPNVVFAGTSAKDETIDLNKKKRFSTLTCRSISGTLTGAVEIGRHGWLYGDDYIEDIEEAMSPDRLESKWNAYWNQLVDRKLEGASELLVGTRWATRDVIGRLQELYPDDPTVRFRVIPALNDKDESNFIYKNGLGFSTEHYKNLRAVFEENKDLATWYAKYQGKPYERGELMFPPDDFTFYNGVLPDGEHQVMAVTDVAWGGGDSLATIFAYIFGKDVYIHDVIFNRGDKTITRPIVVGRILQHKPYKVRFEANNGGHEYADKVDEILRGHNYRCNIFSKKAPNNQSKLARIEQFSPEIKSFYYIGDKYRNQEYRMFMKEVHSMSRSGRNPHDDGADALAMLADELYKGGREVEILKRPW